MASNYQDIELVHYLSFALAATNHCRFPQVLEKMDVHSVGPLSAPPTLGPTIESLNTYAGAHGPVQTFRTA